MTAIQAAGLQLHERATNFRSKILKVLPVVLPSSMFPQMLLSFIYSWVDHVLSQKCMLFLEAARKAGKSIVSKIF